MGELKRRIIAAMEPTEYELARRWIPVAERLPEDGEKVIAFFHRFGDVGEAVYDKDINAFSDGRGGCWDATHWMPLPPKPPEAT